MSNPIESPPDRALAVWRARPDLQEAFDVDTPQGRANLGWWYFLHGFREIGFDLDKHDRAEFLNQPQPGLRHLGFAPISRLMFEMHRRQGNLNASRRRPWYSSLTRLIRNDLGRQYSLDTQEKQECLLTWYFTEGLAGLNLLELLSQDQANALLEPDPHFPGSSRIMAMVWQADARLREAAGHPGDSQALEWCNEHGRRDWPILSHELIALVKRPKAPTKLRSMLPFGVNLFGHARARLGIGEDVRMAARVLDEAGVPYVVCDVSAGSIAAEEHGLDGRIAETMPYAINLFCMTGMETVATVLARGRAHFEDHINIGFWPWELPQWPSLWQHAYGFVDEVWASTGFAAEAFRASATVPVMQMPMAVTVDATEGLDRASFELQDDAFLFGFAFDGLSSFSRKNPEACVKAFQEAFPDQETPVGLVLKGLRVTDNPCWQRLVEASEADPRIRLLTGSYTRGALLDLFRAIDCFVSLHRSEGFGRNIAEAMLLGKPVIATAFSGNVDFTRGETSFQVPFRLRQLQTGEYPFGEGLCWAEPDVAEAARLMREIVTQPARRAAIASDGRVLVAANYAPEVLAEIYRKELRKRYDDAFARESCS